MHDEDDRPAARATIRGDTVTLNRWTHRMVGRGPAADGIRHVRAALADLRRTEDRELIVTPVRDTPWDAGAEEAVLRWAAVVGYVRVWLPGRVVVLDHVPTPSDVAHVRCPSCGARWSDHDLPFWEMVRRDGWFPGSCPACGGSLPEWSVAPAPGRTGDDHDRRVRTQGDPATHRA